MKFEFAKDLTEAERETFASRLIELANVLESVDRGSYTTFGTLLAGETPEAMKADVVGHAILRSKDLFKELQLVANVNDKGEAIVAKKEKPDEAVSNAEFQNRINKFFGPKANDLVFKSFATPPKRAIAAQRLRSAALRRYGYASVAA